VFSTLDHALTGRSVGVLGCGPVGLFAIAIASSSGAASVFAVDPHEYRLDLARKMGASRTFGPGRDASASDVAALLTEANGGHGLDVALEMSGAETAINTAFKAAAPGGRVTLFGIPSRAVSIEDLAGDVIFKNLTVRALSGRRIFETWYRTRWLLESGAVDIRPIVTHEMRVSEIDAAIELLRSGMAGKIVMRPDGNGG
jgi:threonine 3-dehydrogenase